MIVFITNRKYPSARIRGEQIAERLKVKCDPSELNSNDVVIFVKAYNALLMKKVRKVYVDLIDSDSLLPFLEAHPEYNIIAISNLAQQYISSRINNEVVVIPEHHCNFDKDTRLQDKPIKVVGYVGSKFCLDLDVDELTDELDKVNLDFKYLFCDDLYITREQVCDFYKSIDIQLCFRKPKLIANMPPEMKNPLKLQNAGSFRIPTVSYPELNYEVEFAMGYYPVYDLEEAVCACNRLASTPKLYENYAQRAFGLSQDGHIDKVVEKYKELEE